MRDQQIDRLLRGLKSVLDDAVDGGHRNCGPMRISMTEPAGDKDKHRVTIESGWDYAYGGMLTIEASKTGKSLRIWKDGVELAPKENT